MSLRTGALLLGMALAGSVSAADWSVCPGWNEPSGSADGSYGYWAYFSPYTYHWSDKNAADHRQVFALSVSKPLPDDRFCGFSLFRNSFGQPSAYAFTGWSWPQLFDAHPNVYGTVSAGIIYGYVGKFKDKVPLNFGGFSPVIVPAIGYRVTPKLSVEVQVLGTAALMFGSSWRF